MFRILKSFAWLRWRIFLNTLNRTSGRDSLQRLSLVLERLTPIALLVVLVPSAMALAAVSGFIGYQLAHDTPQQALFELLRFVLLAGTLAAIIGPMLVPTGDRTNPVRLLLLPIPARTLYVAQTGATLTDPWLFLHIPVAIALPIGLLAGGAGAAAAIVLVAGAALVLVVIGVAALVTTLIHLVLRNRRRGELVALILLIALPMMGFLPSIVGVDRRARRERPTQTEQRPEPGRSPVRPALVSATGRIFAVMPSELYTATARRAARGGATSAAAPLAGILAIAGAVHAIGLAVFRRALRTTGSTGPRRATSLQGLWSRVLPGVSPPTSAVALSLVRLALRTPRGRATLVIPVAFTLVFILVLSRQGSFDVGPFATRNGLGFATLAAFLGLLGSLPISANQFAVDRAGLTMTLLSPLSTREVLVGKAIGAGLVSVPPALLCIVMTSIAFPTGSPFLWLALALSVCATYVLASPVVALLSALLPRVVDMNSVGSSSNAHVLAGFGGLVAFAVSALPCAALTFAATVLLGLPTLAPLFLLIWCVAAFAIARLLFRHVEKLFDARRENLAMLM